MPFQHGIRVTEVNEGARAISTISSSIIGMVVTADDADAAAFPLNEAVLITNIEDAIGKAGDSGTMAVSLNTILDETRTLIVLVRVAEDEDPDTQIANIIGGIDDDGHRIGMQALLSSQSKFGFRPRILGAPYLDNVQVTNAMLVIAQRLNGFVYASAPAVTNEGAIQYGGQFGQRELMLITPDIKITGGGGAIEAGSAIAKALGHRAKLDQTIGWHKSLSNETLNGVLGVTRDIEFDMLSSDNDAGVLNDAGLTTIINRDGYRFWGNRTRSADPLFAFEVTVRTAQILRDTIAEGLIWALDKPLTPGLAKDIISSINNKFAALTSQGLILGAKCLPLDAAKNPTDTLKQGILNLDYEYTPVPPLENINLVQRITETFLVDFTVLANAA